MSILIFQHALLLIYFTLQLNFLTLVEIYMGFILGPAQKDNDQILHALFGDWDSAQQQYICPPEEIQAYREGISASLQNVHMKINDLPSKIEKEYERLKKTVKTGIRAIIRNTKSSLDSHCYKLLAGKQKNHSPLSGLHNLLGNEVFLNEYRQYIKDGAGPILACEIPLIANAFNISIKIIIAINGTYEQIKCIPIVRFFPKPPEHTLDPVTLYIDQKEECHRIVKLDNTQDLTPPRIKRDYSTAFSNIKESSSPTKKVKLEDSDSEKENFSPQSFFTPLSPLHTKRPCSSEEISPSELINLSPWKFSSKEQ